MILWILLMLINYYFKKDGISSLSKTLLLYNMNDLCHELQKRYEIIMDLLEKSVNEIWNYPTAADEANKNNSFLYQSFQSYDNTVQTEFSKLDVKFRYPPELANKRTWKLHIYE